MGTLFVLDDDKVFFWITKMMNIKNRLFKKMTHFEDGSKLIDYLTVNQHRSDLLPDIIFVDLNMPLFDGWQFLDAYSKLNKSFSKEITFYITSCSVMASDKQRAASYGIIKEFIEKPVTSEKMRAIFRDLNSSAIA